MVQRINHVNVFQKNRIFQVEHSQFSAQNYFSLGPVNPVPTINLKSKNIKMYCIISLLLGGRPKWVRWLFQTAIKRKFRHICPNLLGQYRKSVKSTGFDIYIIHMLQAPRHPTPFIHPTYTNQSRICLLFMHFCYFCFLIQLSIWNNSSVFFFWFFRLIGKTMLCFKAFDHKMHSVRLSLVLIWVCLRISVAFSIQLFFIFYFF